MVLGDRAEHLALPGGAWAIRLPEEPGYWWGNFLLFPEAPGPEALTAWPEAFAGAFGALPAVRHQAFGWDDPTGARGHSSDLEAAGLLLQEGVVLVGDSGGLSLPEEGAVVRPLLSDGDWAQACDNQIACRGEGHDPAPYRAFKVAQMAGHRAAVASGRAAWFGAFVGERLVADCGLYVEGTLGRFQSVGTAPGFRRQGHARSLVAGATRWGLTRMGAKQLVIVSDEEGPARRVYEGLGYRAAERALGLVRPAPGAL
jgi:GNAT superfamily N-acetyltransferase